MVNNPQGNIVVFPFKGEHTATPKSPKFQSALQAVFDMNPASNVNTLGDLQPLPSYTDVCAAHGMHPNDLWHNQAIFNHALIRGGHDFVTQAMDAIKTAYDHPLLEERMAHSMALFAHTVISDIRNHLQVMYLKGYSEFSDAQHLADELIGDLSDAIFELEKPQPPHAA